MLSSGVAATRNSRAGAGAGLPRRAAGEGAPPRSSRGAAGRQVEAGRSRGDRAGAGGAARAGVSCAARAAFGCPGSGGSGGRRKVLRGERCRGAGLFGLAAPSLPARPRRRPPRGARSGRAPPPRAPARGPGRGAAVPGAAASQPSRRGDRGAACDAPTPPGPSNGASLASRASLVSWQPAGRARHMGVPVRPAPERPVRGRPGVLLSGRKKGIRVAGGARPYASLPPRGNRLCSGGIWVLCRDTGRSAGRREISRAQGSRACRCLGEQCSGQGAQPVQRLRLHLEEVGASGPRMTVNQLACLAPLPWHF